MEGSVQHDSERHCIAALRAEVTRLRRKQRSHDKRDEECESLRFSATTFSELAERLALRLKEHSAGDSSIRAAHRRDQRAVVQATLDRVITELQQLTVVLRSEESM